MKNYWEGRTVRQSNNLGSIIKRSRLTQGLTNLLFSVRSADEIFISRILRKRKVKAVLDVACGLGKDVIPSIAEYTAGVDIAGYPANIALGKGYNECVQYESPDYNFKISRQVDAITSIHLNAHVPFDAYYRILDKSLQFLRPGGAAVLINEYNNDGLSYQRMRRDFEKFDSLVKRMEHWHLEYEKSFTARFDAAFGNLKLIERRPLIAGFLPSLHYYAYYTGHDPSPATMKSFVLTDIPISVMNFAQSSFSPRFNKCFTVGYVYEKLAS